MESRYEDYAREVPRINVFFMLIPDRTYPAAGVHNTIGPRPSIVSVGVSEYEDGKTVK